MVNFEMIQYCKNFQRIKRTDDMQLDCSTVYIYPLFDTSHIGLKNGEIGVFYSSYIRCYHYSTNHRHFIRTPHVLRRFFGVQLPDFKISNGGGYVYGQPLWCTFDSLIKIAKNTDTEIACFRQCPPELTIVLFLKAIRNL